MPTFPKTKPYSLDGRPKMEQLLWIRSLPQVYAPHLLDLTGWGSQGKASSWRKTDSDCLQPRLSQSVSVKFCVGKISRREHYVSCINYLQIGRSIQLESEAGWSSGKENIIPALTWAETQFPRIYPNHTAQVPFRSLCKEEPVLIGQPEASIFVGFRLCRRH